MLERLLHLLKSEGMLTTGELARRLGVSPSLVTAMLDDLARRGLLQKTGSGSETLNLSTHNEGCSQPACGGCALSGSCKPLLNRSWSL